MARLPPLLCLLLAGCAVSHGVRPLPKGQGAVTASLGGPISKDLPTPVAFAVPITTIGYAHGISDTTTVHGAVHPTGLAALGVFAADAGVAHQLVDTHGARPRLMLDGDLIVAGGRVPDTTAAAGTLVFADVQAIASWDLGRHAAYVGLDQFVQPAPTFGYWLSPLFGGVLSAGRTDLQLELQWLAPHLDNTLQAAEFVGPFGLGATSVKVGLGFHLGKQGGEG